MDRRPSGRQAKPRRRNPATSMGVDTMYKIVENADGTATIRRAFSGSVVGTHVNADDARTWIADKLLADETAQRATDKGMKTTCHYCGTPTIRGVCRECGTEI